MKDNDFDEYSWDTEDNSKDDRVFVLIIYDIIDNKTRLKLAKFLQGYGVRVQKSAFEALLTKKKYKKLLNEIGKFTSLNNSIRIYKMTGKGQVTTYGKLDDEEFEDFILI